MISCLILLFSGNQRICLFFDLGHLLYRLISSVCGEISCLGGGEIQFLFKIIV